MTLFVVATPIGNLEDLTERAARTLREVDLVLAEDTRHARTLLTRAGATTPTRSYHDHSTDHERDTIIAALAAGQRVALISDAGTPCIADPGFKLVRLARQRGVDVCPIPGASALTAFLSAAGLPTDRFLFDGFLPQKAAARDKRLTELLAAPWTSVVYESPRRLEETLAAINTAAPDRHLVVARELTKVHETFYTGTAAVIANAITDAQGWRGEIVVGISPAPERDASDDELDAWIAALVAEGVSARSIASVLQSRLGVPRKRAYERALAALEQRDGEA